MYRIGSARAQPADSGRKVRSEVSKTLDWSAPVSGDEAVRRAAGRRHYNARRTEEKLLRRQEVTEMLLDNGHRWGSQAAMARALGVSESTISRDVDAILRGDFHACPTCDRVLDRWVWKDLARRGRVVVTDVGVRLPPVIASQPTAAQEPASLAALEYLRGEGLAEEEDTTPST